MKNVETVSSGLVGRVRSVTALKIHPARLPAALDAADRDVVRARQALDRAVLHALVRKRRLECEHEREQREHADPDVAQHERAAPAESRVIGEVTRLIAGTPCERNLGHG